MKGALFMIQIDFLDSDFLNALVPIRTLEPDIVYFLVDHRTVTLKQVRNIKMTIQSWKPRTRVHYTMVDNDDMYGMQHTLDLIVQNLPRDEETYIDLAGGTEMMSICGFETARKYGLTPVYLDDKRQHLVDIRTRQNIRKVKHISVNDYIMAQGAGRKQNSHDLPEEDEFDRICEMAEYMFSHLSCWNGLAITLGRLHKSTGGAMEITLPELFRSGLKKQLVDRIEALGFWKNTGRWKYTYASRKYQKYLITYGVWLEMYIYIKAKNIFNECCLGLVLDWEADNQKKDVSNEIDVLVMKDSTPVFISCKMREINSSDVYEVGYLAKQFAGYRGKACIATCVNIRQNQKPNGIFQRMKRMRVGLLEVDMFQKKQIGHVFNEALQMT